MFQEASDEFGEFGFPKSFPRIFGTNNIAASRIPIIASAQRTGRAAKHNFANSSIVISFSPFLLQTQIPIRPMLNRALVRIDIHQRIHLFVDVNARIWKPLLGLFS
jgi:hypothetical protein